jgi:hypothetical protein
VVSKLEKVQFGLFVMLPAGESKSTEPQSTTTKLLGSASYNIADGMEKLLKGKAAHSILTFIRRPQPEVEVPVGRIAVTVSLMQPSSDTVGTYPATSQRSKASSRSTLLKPGSWVHNNECKFSRVW